MFTWIKDIEHSDKTERVKRKVLSTQFNYNVKSLAKAKLKKTTTVQQSAQQIKRKKIYDNIKAPV